MATLLHVHAAPVPHEALSRSLLPVIADEAPGREAAVFGVFSGRIGVTDGRHVLYHYPPDTAREGLVEYTLAPSHMTAPFTIGELRTARLAPPFDFTKGVPLLGIDAMPDAARPPNNDGRSWVAMDTSLYDLAEDPGRAREETT